MKTNGWVTIVKLSDNHVYRIIIRKHINEERMKAYIEALPQMPVEIIPPQTLIQIEGLD